MYTICPSCLRYFRLHAEHLSAASGKVRCGYCQAVFNALEHLYDSKDAPAQRRVARKVRPEAAAVASIAPQSLAPGDAEDWTEEPFLLDVLGGAEAPTHPHPLWWVAAVSLLILFSLQLAWNYRADLQRLSPAVQSMVQRLCATGRCQPQRQGSLAGLMIHDRDIRLHPDYEETLLVNATVVNHSGQAMAYPDLQLRLSDAAAVPVAFREFTPMEYLHSDRQVSTGLHPGDQFHILLELTGPITDAEAFEVGFAYPVSSILR